MSEKLHCQPFDGPTAVAEEDLAPAAAVGEVSVAYGVHAHNFPLAGLRIRDARAQLEERMNIAPDAAAVVDGNEADEDVILGEGQVLTFVQPAGEKG
jgi:hypothetical protein